MEIYNGPLTMTCEDKRARAAYRFFSKFRKKRGLEVTITPRSFVTVYIKNSEIHGLDMFVKPLSNKVESEKDLWFFPKNLVKSKEYIQGGCSFSDQKKRCEHTLHKQYYRYGARGIKVRYDRYSFIKWWLENLKTFEGKTPTVGRIDHDKDYSFENIVMQDKSENSKERAARGKMNGHKFFTPRIEVSL